MANWDQLGPGLLTGFSGGAPDSGSGGVASGVTNSVATAASSTAPLWSPDNPLFWLAVLLGLVTGAVVVSSAVNLGPIKARAKV